MSIAKVSIWLLLSLMPFVVAEDGVWINGKGKGKTRKSAIRSSWKSAMNNYIKQNLGRDYSQHSTKIKTFLRKNWKKYAIGNTRRPIVVKKYYNQRITIKTHIRAAKLLTDVNILLGIQNQPKIPQTTVDDNKWYQGSGRGSSVAAISKAWKNIMKQFIREQIGYEKYSNHEKKIENFINENYPNYRKSDPKIIKKMGRQVTIKGRIHGSKLLGDITSVIEPLKHLANREISLIIQSEFQNRDQEIDNKTMIQVIQDRLLKNKIVAYVIQPGEKPKGNITIILSVSTNSIYDKYQQEKTWHATVNSLGKNKQRPLWNHSSKTGGRRARPIGVTNRGDRGARTEAVRTVSKVAVKKIIQKLQNVK